jgi:anti-sigma B factor antagonist
MPGRAKARKRWSDVELTRTEKPGLMLIGVTGEVDMRNSPDLRRELLDLCSRFVPHVVVDLEKVAYIDSSGIATLVECMKNVKRYGGRLTLIGVNDDIFPVFELARLDHVFDIRRDKSFD